jgi:hypothetical protein
MFGYHEQAVRSLPNVTSDISNGQVLRATGSLLTERVFEKSLVPVIPLRYTLILMQFAFMKEVPSEDNIGSNIKILMGMMRL